MNKITVLTALLVSSISELSKVSIIVAATNETISSKDAAEILCNKFDDFRLSINDHVYRQYHKTEKVWIFTNNYYANLLAIYDGWSNSQRYFDITAYGSALNGGALVRFDYAI